MEGLIFGILRWLVVGRKFTIFALFYLVFEGKFQVQAPRGAYIQRGDLTEGFFALRFWGAFIWRGLFLEFYSNHSKQEKNV